MKFILLGIVVLGMGYIGFGMLFTVVMCGMFLLYNALDFGTRKNGERYKTLTVTIPEDPEEYHSFVTDLESLGEAQGLKIHVMHEDIFNAMHRI